MTGMAPNAACEAPAASSWTTQDCEILASVDEALDVGIALRRWWEDREARSDYADRFQLARSFNRPDEAFGFFDVATVRGRRLNVMGVVQRMVYDEPKGASPQLRAEFREFVLTNFLRVSD